VGGGIGGGLIISQASTPGVQPELVKGSNPATHVTAAVYYTPRKSGTAMQVQVSGIPDGTRCRFWLTTFGGQHLLAGTWVVNDYHGNWNDAWSPVAASQVRSFDISAGGRELVTIPAT
jgi:hypothetical protein